MHDLPRRMHAGVRAPSAHHLNRNTGELLQGVLHGILHRTATRLRLPATKTAPVVFDSQGNSHSSGLPQPDGRQRTGDQRQNQEIPPGERPFGDFEHLLRVAGGRHVEQDTPIARTRQRFEVA